MVTNVRVNEVLASIAVSSGGTGRSTIETVVQDLRKSIGATDEAAREALNRAVDLKFVKRDGDQVCLMKETFAGAGS